MPSATRVSGTRDIRDPRERRGERSTGMSGEWEYDPYEYAEELAAGEDLGRSDLSRPRGAEDERGRLDRRELIARGGAGAAAIGGLGAFAGTGCGRQRRLQRGRRERQVHRHAAGALPRGRVPDPGHREAGLQGPRLHGEACPRTVGEAAADRDHAARHVRRLRRLQLPVAAGLAVRRPPAGRHAQAQGLEARSTSSSPTASSTRPRRGARTARATRPSAPRSSIRTAPRVCRPTPTARRATSRSSAGSARTASRSAGSRRPAGSSAPRRTSTPTRWATTPT